MKVRAKTAGWYGNKRRREGDVFELEAPFKLGAWMEKVEEKQPAGKAKKSKSAEAEVQPPQDEDVI